LFECVTQVEDWDKVHELTPALPNDTTNYGLPGFGMQINSTPVVGNADEHRDSDEDGDNEGKRRKSNSGKSLNSSISSELAMVGYQAPSFGPLNALVSSLATMEVLKKLTGIGTVRSLGTELEIDPMTLAITEIGFDRDENCWHCGIHPLEAKSRGKANVRSHSWHSPLGANLRKIGVREF
jgi:hypothetical protein